MIESMESTEMRPIRPRWDGRVMDKGGQSPCLSSTGECRELTEKGTEPSGSREFKTTRLAQGQLKRGWRERYCPSAIPFCGRCGSM